ncbi:hypothetical protein H9L19_08105 [Weissella diestrammenae]|uniref:Uncharacterized protein n=1 Tax=Weissella diestrammenae TaxID=1162633 RepID=A0A7G9T5D6_9LACO|nr:hypothetical protein [Weissella diestrammenae]MCM0583171.1 hypothetical protein [Weissella diestrammenae]QNN75311.1 hypothetical protein H9L19_08105 [Weissella diestrammenae]
MSNLSPIPVGTEKTLLNQAKSLKYLRIEKRRLENALDLLSNALLHLKNDDLTNEPLVKYIDQMLDEVNQIMEC